jgi:hypothetical protein
MITHFDVQLPAFKIEGVKSIRKVEITASLLKK